MTCEELELLTDIRDFTTLFVVILRCECIGRLIKTGLISYCSLEFVLLSEKYLRGGARVPVPEQRLVIEPIIKTENIKCDK